MGRGAAVRRLALGAVVLLVLLVVASAVMGIGLVRRAWPQTNGSIALEGLAADVTVVRDTRGVPQIYADDPVDLFRAQGFAAAQDRFFQMDLRRHVTAGRLAELVGPAGVDSDKMVRTLGWRKVAEEELPRLAPATRRYLSAYADGVNDYLASSGDPSNFGVEYTVLAASLPEYRVERWTALDSLTWLKAMAWDLRSNLDSELARGRLSGLMDAASLAALYPAYPSEQHQPILSERDWQPPQDSAASPSPPAVSVGPASDAAPSSAWAASKPPSVSGASLVSALSPAPEPSASEPTAATPSPVPELSSGPGASLASTPSLASGLSSGAGAPPSSGASRAPSRVPARGAAPASSAEEQAALEAATGAVRAVSDLLGVGEGLGSNSWVVGPRRTTTGHALLANDPHLGVSAPGIWQQVGLHCRTVSATCPFDVSGFAFAGMPGVAIGHNARIAWGFTNLGADVTDLYFEKVEGQSYLRDGRQVPLAVREEVVKVAGGPDVPLTIRRSSHGPLISDVLPAASDIGNRPILDGVLQQGQSYAVSLAWTALVPSATADAIFQINTATGFDQFRSAARGFAVPSQNLVYADVDGHIGYQAPGLVPVRRPAENGSPPGYLPAPGWDSRWDWQGFVPFEQLPWAYDPPEGFLVAANQQVSTSATPFLTADWDAGWRSQRITDLLTANARVSPEQLARIQTDDVNGFARTLVEALLKIDLSADPFTEEAQALLRDWNYTQPADDSKAAAAAAYFNSVWAELVRAAFDDQLPTDLRADGGGRWWLVVAGLLTDPRNGWWDDRRTPSVVENRDEILHRALVQARLDLTRKLGSDISDWSWGKLHTLTFTHPVLGRESAPGPVRSLVNRGPIALPGGSASVNANSWNAAQGFAVTNAPSMRMVVDLGNLDASTWVNQTGASGHPYHPNYVDQLDAWAAGTTFPWPFTPAAVEAARVDHLTLTRKQ